MFLFQITTSQAQLLGVTPVASSSGISPMIAAIIGFWIFVAVVILLLFLLRQFLILKGHRRESQYGMHIFLVTIPKYKKQEDSSMPRHEETVRAIGVAESFFASIGGLKYQRGFLPWLFGRDDHMSFEMVVHEGVIKFYFAVPTKLVGTIQQQLLAQYPDAHVEEVEDYNIFDATGTILGAYLQFSRPDGFPLRTYEELEADPMQGLTNTLSKLEENEGAAIQFIVRSAPPRWRTKGLAIAKRIQSGMSLDEALAGKKKGESKLTDVFSKEADVQKRLDKEKEYRVSPQEEEVVKRIEQKASKSGMEVNIRIVVSTQSDSRSQVVLGEIFNGFSQFNIYEYGNKFVRAIPRSKKRVIRRFIYRGFEPRQKIVLNTEELASLWHPPLPWTETPNILWMKARRAVAPVNTPKEGLYLGYNMYRGVKTPVHIGQSDRQRHMYIIGRSGSGKSQFIASMAIQDIVAGHGVCVLDPHGDLAEQVLGNIPKDRIDDVIVFDPSDMDRPVGLNMLEVENENQQDFVVQEMISIFYKLFPPEMIGPMFEHNMRNVMLTLTADPENPGTIVEIPRMFSDEEFAKTRIDKVKDPVVRAFWEKEMAKTSDFHKSEMLGYLVSKVGRFVENTMMRNIMGQERSGFSFREVMDQGKVLIVNLSKGKTGEVNASLLGLIIVAKLQMAALARADMAEEDRKDFYLYIDEFQNFVTDSIATILSEARKYKLDLIMGHQYMAQLVKDGKSEVRDAVLGNVGTMFVSRVGADDTEVLEKEFAPTFSAYDLINTEKFTWYTKMIIDNDAQKPFTMHTEMPSQGNPKLADAIKELARLKHGRDRALVEAEIIERTQLASIGTSQPPPVGEV
ncbi:MAG: type IV secretion system DNA-binding domain-containing protein [bacterium]|nr:type IV secretion system DNA-binding domain-containing protein [bacterium]